MSDRFSGETPPPAPVPRLLLALPSRAEIFLANLRDTLFPRQLPPLDLQSAPAPFWTDVFVTRPLPWGRFLQSIGLHFIAFGLLMEFAHVLALRPEAVPSPVFNHAQVIVYQPTPYLPPLDTREPEAEHPRKADAELARQPIISVPRETDNRTQTIVTPPAVKMKHDVALPNIVAWSDRPQKPRLEIPDVPLTPAAEITRLAPRMDSMVAPPPDGAHLNRQYASPMLQASVVAPPTDIQRSGTSLTAPQTNFIAPPSSVQADTRRLVGDLNIAPSAVIAPAPQLAVSPQRSVAGGGGRPSLAPQVVAPPPSLLAGGSYAPAATGSAGRLIALNLHPVLTAPPDSPGANRRGTFAATTSGHAGASGDPGAAVAKGNESESASGHQGARDVPSGLYVGDAGARPSPVAGNGDAGSARQPTIVASVRMPRATGIPAATSSSTSANKLSEEEREVFRDRKFYSLTLNMPNLNSAGGSWVIRFAELDPSAANRTGQPADLSQPSATRKVDPAYPLQLMRENVAGTVILYAVIHSDGTVGNVRVLRSVDDRLDRYASQAVAQWQFHPATKNGTPVDVEATFQIPFKPARVGSPF